MANHADVWSVLRCQFKQVLTHPASRRDALSVLTIKITLARFRIRLTCFWLGFLPVLYTWLRAKYQTAPVFLPSDPDEDESPSSKLDASSEDLTGWKVLLLWLPAACDLAGTTVRLFLEFVFFSHQAHSLRGANTASTAHERWSSIYACFHLPDVTWRARPICGHSQRDFFASPSMAVPVRIYDPSSSHGLNSPRWISLLTVMAGVSLVGYSGSLIKDTAKANVSLFSTGTTSEPNDEPDLTKVLIGTSYRHPSLSQSRIPNNVQACFS